MKKLPTWSKVIIIIICLPIGYKFGYKFGYAIMEWILDLLNF